ncbi:cell filamentation protein Fic [Candidatus Peregrinibacteria bacterium]|nr:MAG: cell filamentation protein Fic [Candidatus Peregrinibacteria bacterium]
MPHQQIIIYQTKGGKIKVDALLQDESLWMTQEQIALLFGRSKSTINEHIQNIYSEKEQLESETLKKFGISEFQQKTPNYYNLDLILAVGYRVKSQQGILFRIWATQRLKEYLIQGFSLNEEKLKSGKTTQYFDKLQSKLREIRLSERVFYQKVKDIYTTSIDYDPKNDKTIEFFTLVQNKLLWAISKQTAAELVHSRIDSTKPFLGMKSFDKKTEKEITKKDVSIAKNYLNKDEIKILELIVEQYLAFAESMAHSQTPMKMVDWIQRLDVIVQMNGKEILTHYGKVSHALAVEKSDNEYKDFKQEQKEEEKKESLKELEQDLKNLGNEMNS